MPILGVIASSYAQATSSYDFIEKITLVDLAQIVLHFLLFQLHISIYN